MHIGSLAKQPTNGGEIEEQEVLVTGGLAGGGKEIRREDLDEHRSIERWELVNETINNDKGSGAFGLATKAVAHAKAYVKEGRGANEKELYDASKTGRGLSGLAEVGAAAVKTRAAGPPSVTRSGLTNDLRTS